MNIDIEEAQSAYLTAREFHASLYQYSADKWHLQSVRIAVGNAFGDMEEKQRLLIDTIGGHKGQAYVLALEAELKAEGVLSKARALREALAP